MAFPRTRKDFLNTEEGKEVKLRLQSMIDDNLYNTAASYSNDTDLYPDNLIPFVDKHMNYLVNHPMLEASQYLANVRLVTRLRR
jgi:hypothetical protein